MEATLRSWVAVARHSQDMLVWCMTWLRTLATKGGLRCDLVHPQGKYVGMKAGIGMVTGKTAKRPSFGVGGCSPVGTVVADCLVQVRPEADRLP